MKELMFRILGFALMLSMVSCATDYKRRPDGGPSDRTRPEINSVSLQDGSLSVDRDTAVEIVFSEYIDRNSTRNALSISPSSAQKRSKVFWYDKSLKIEFDGLDDDLTVVININPNLKDTQGNPLASSFSTSFATGERIDKKTVSGRVSGVIEGSDISTLSYQNVRVNLYRVHSDSMRFESEEPEYSSGISPDGSFELKNLSSGDYKLITFTDVNKNARPDFGSETVSFSPGLCGLNTDDSLFYELTLGFNDTDPPFVKNTSLAEKNVLMLEFSEDISFNPGIIDSLQINGVIKNFKVSGKASEKNAVWIETGEPGINDRITVFLGEVRDVYGNIINGRLRVKEHTVTDTVPSKPFKIVSRLPSKISSDRTLQIITNSFANEEVSVSALSLKDSLERHPGKEYRNLPYEISLGTDEMCPFEGDYELHIAVNDSLAAKHRFSVAEPLGTGSVSGTIQGSSQTGYMVVFKPVRDGEKNAIQAAAGTYKADLRPGKYICAAFEDRSAKGVFGHDLYRSGPSQAVFYADTVLVRRNWESTDIDFKFNNIKKGR